MRWRLRWPDRAKIRPPEEDLTADREEAAATRERNEGKLREEVGRTAEVIRVAATSRKLRARNNFAERITESFRGQGSNGTAAR